MKFYGLEKLSLVDFDGHTAATVFTGGCNWLCPFCHNSGLVRLADFPYVYDEEEILDYLKKRAGLLDGLAITGGEPTLHKELKEFCRKVKDLGYDIKLDTNGTNPDFVADMIEKKLVDYLAMDIKNSRKKYPETVGKAVDQNVLNETIGLLKERAPDYEFRTTLVKEFHSAEDIEDISDWIQGAKRYALQHFHDEGNNLVGGFHEVPEEEAQRFLEIAKKKMRNVKLRGY
ncbi:MAG: anaerobic ribonucleoside-triphosphate reductase activating protein [Clostridia bacterium]|nr:anaerobic ribonucleoside-triphosphate reductase activating protein [Clostridia bacterium]